MSNFRHIRVNEFNRGNLYGSAINKIRTKNMNAHIDDHVGKYWDFIKVLKTTTNVLHWLIRIDDNFYAISQSNMKPIGEVCSVYETDSKGRYDSTNAMVHYIGYLDIESAADRFATEYIANLINKKSEKVKFLLEKL